MTTTLVVDEGGEKTEDGSRLGLPEDEFDVGDFVLENFDDLFVFVFDNWTSTS